MKMEKKYTSRNTINTSADHFKNESAHEILQRIAYASTEGSGEVCTRAFTVHTHRIGE